MSEITCSKAKTCARLHRLGTHACSNCSHKPADEPAGTYSDEETADNEPQTDSSEEMEHDEYGNEGRHLFRVKLSKTEYYSCYIDIAADSEDDALARAEEADVDDWECDDCDYDSPTIDQTLS